MSTRSEKVSWSDKSVLYRDAKDAGTKEIGKDHKIAVPVISIDKLRTTLGPLLTNGDGGMIYDIKGSSPPRVYKIFREEKLTDGDEIRISEIAGRLGVGPTFYGAFSVQNGDKNLVVFEMDHVGKSLGEQMGNFAPPTGGDDRPPMEVSVEKLYGSSEAFYCALFRKIVLLADHNIAHRDGNVGNIIPKLEGEKKDLMLIDYGGALLADKPKAALHASIDDETYYGFFYKRFQSLPNKSEEGTRLLALLKEKLDSSE